MHGHYNNKQGNACVNFYALMVLLSKGTEIYFPLLIVHTEINPAVQETRQSFMLSPASDRIYFTKTFTLASYCPNDVSWINLVKPFSVTNAYSLLEARGQLASSLFLHFGCFYPAILNVLYPKLQYARYMQGFSSYPPCPASSRDSSFYSQERYYGPSLRARLFTFLCSFFSLLLACWFNQFYQMTFLAAVERKPRAD